VTDFIAYKKLRKSCKLRNGTAKYRYNQVRHNAGPIAEKLPGISINITAEQSA
jgi:hypothetical protein